MSDEKVNPKNLMYYTIKIEADIPSTVTYRILASSPEEALERLPYAVLSEPVKPHLSKMKKKSAKVFKSGTLEIKMEKKY